MDFRFNEKKQQYLDSISNNIENQLLDMNLEDVEILYVMENVKRNVLRDIKE